jgi:hypothetical protein
MIGTFPNGLCKKIIGVVSTRWLLFKSVKDYAIGSSSAGFPESSVFLTSFQIYATA